MSSYQANLKQNGALILLLLAAALLAPSYWTALHTPATGVYHDDSIYLITARTLAEGRGYWIESIPEPIAQTKYPILFPALLAIVWKLAPDFPSNVIYFKLLPFAATLVWLYLSYRLINRLSGSRILAATAIALTASSPQVVFFSTTVLSETLFAALATAAILFWTKTSDSGSKSALILSAIFAAAAYHTRTIGFCLILSALVAFAWQKKWKEASIFAAVAGSLALPWIFWQALHVNAPDPYLSQENYYSAYNIVMSFGWNEKLRIAMLNLLALPLSVQSFFDLSWGALPGFICLPLILRAFIGKELPFIVKAFLIFSLSVILMWVWPPLRFMVPLMPLLVWAVWCGVPGMGKKILLPCCWLLFGQGVWASHTFSEAALESGFWSPAPAGKHEWREFTRQMDWLKVNTLPSAIVQSNLDPTIYLFSNRKAIRGSYQNVSLSWYLDKEQVLGTPDEFEKTLRQNQVRFIVEVPWSWFMQSRFVADLVSKASQGNPSEFKLRYKSELEGFRIFEFQPPQQQEKTQ